MSKYYKHVWQMGELISSTLLNAIENQLETVAPGATSITNNYNSSTTYEKGDYCLYNGDLWRCLTQSVNNAPEEGTRWTKVMFADDIKDKLNAIDYEEIQNKANINGNYSSLTAGSAEQLLTSSGEWDKVPYNLRTTAGSVNAGSRVTEKIVGGSVAWNQWVQNGDFSDGTTGWTESSGVSSFSVSNGVCTMLANQSGGAVAVDPDHRFPIIKGHKYLVSARIKLTTATTAVRLQLRLYDLISLYTQATTDWQIVAGIKECTEDYNNTAYVRVYDGRSSNFDAIQFTNVQCVDLTQMFGSTIADYIYGLEQANAGAGVAWFKKLFPKPYYPYNAGELMSVKTSAHKTVGFNAWDEEWEVGGISNTTGENGASSDRIRSKNYIPVIQNTAYYIKAANPVGLRYYDQNKTFISYDTAQNQIRTMPSGCCYLRFIVLNQTTYNHDICINLAWDNSRNSEYEPYEENIYLLDSDLELRGIPKLDSGNNLYYDGDTYESDGTVTRRYGIVDLGTVTWEKVVSTTVTVGYYFKANIPGYLCYPSRNRIISRPYTQYPQNGISNIVAANGADIDKVLFNTQAANSDVLYIIDSAYSTVEEITAGMSGVYFVYELATPTTESADPFQNPQIVNDFGTEEYVDERTVPIPVGHESFYMTDLKKKIELLPSAPTTNGTYVLKCIVANGIPTFAWQSA